MFVLSWYTAFVVRVEPSSFPTEQLSPIVSKPKLLLGYEWAKNTSNANGEKFKQ